MNIMGGFHSNALSGALIMLWLGAGLFIAAASVSEWITRRLEASARQGKRWFGRAISPNLAMAIRRRDHMERLVRHMRERGAPESVIEDAQGMLTLAERELRNAIQAEARHQ